jgi:hypothetical protein
MTRRQKRGRFPLSVKWRAPRCKTKIDLTKKGSKCFEAIGGFLGVSLGVFRRFGPVRQSYAVRPLVFQLVWCPISLAET